MIKIKTLQKSVFVGITSRGNKGVVDKKTGKQTGINLATLAMVHEFGSFKMNIPQRSFLRQPIITKNEELTKTANHFLTKMLQGQMKEEEFLGIVAEMAVNISASAIEDGLIKPALKPKTIKRKGSNLPLVDTSMLKNSISWEIR